MLFGIKIFNFWLWRSFSCPNNVPIVFILCDNERGQFFMSRRSVFIISELLLCRSFSCTSVLTHFCRRHCSVHPIYFFWNASWYLNILVDHHIYNLMNVINDSWTYVWSLHKVTNRHSLSFRVIYTWVLVCTYGSHINLMQWFLHSGGIMISDSTTFVICGQ